MRFRNVIDITKKSFSRYLVFNSLDMFYVAND